VRACENSRERGLSPPCKRGVKGGGHGETARLVRGSGPLAGPAELPFDNRLTPLLVMPWPPPQPPFARGGKEALATGKGGTKSGVDRAHNTTVKANFSSAQPLPPGHRIPLRIVSLSGR